MPLAAMPPGLYFIVNLDWHLKDRSDPLRLCREVIRGGCSAVQLRFKAAPDREALSLARRLRALTAAQGVSFIVNDRPDLALLCGADGVHVGQEDLPARVVAKLGPGLGVGLSTHTLAQVAASRKERLDYIGFGPVFGTRSKETPWPATGVEALRRAAKLSRAPVVAIGGIDEKNCRLVARAGVRRAAVISCIYRSRDPRATARLIHGILGGGAVL